MNEVNRISLAQGAIYCMSMNCDENRLSFGQAACCEALLEALELHGSRRDFCLPALKAIFHLCDGNANNRLKISFSGAADILMTVLAKHSYLLSSGSSSGTGGGGGGAGGGTGDGTGGSVSVSDRIVEYAFSTMIGMCLDKVGQSRLGTVGVCKVAG